MTTLAPALAGLLVDVRARPTATPAPTAPPPLSTWTEEHVTLRVEGGRVVAAPVSPWDRRCPDCRDGWRIVRRDGYEFAERCACHGLRARVEAMTAARLPPDALGRTLAAYDWARLRASSTARCEGQECSPRAAIARHAERRAPPGRGLLIQGGTGTGKTHLAQGLVQWLCLRHGVRVRWASWAQTLDDLRGAFGAGQRDDTARDHLARLVQAPVLAVDDLGSERGTEWSASVFQGVVGARLEMGGAMVLTTNLRVDADDRDPLSMRRRIGDRAMSRLLGACDVIRLDAEDYRPAPPGATASRVRAR